MGTQTTQKPKYENKIKKRAVWWILCTEESKKKKRAREAIKISQPQPTLNARTSFRRIVRWLNRYSQAPSKRPPNNTVIIVVLSNRCFELTDDDRVVYTRLKPNVVLFTHIPSGILSSSPGSTNVMSAHYSWNSKHKLTNSSNSTNNPSLKCNYARD